MIGSFADRRLKRLFERGEVRRIDPRDLDRIRLVLQRLNLAVEIEDLNLHSYRLHRLTGDRAGFWSITVRANWRIIFRFENGRAYEIELIDYH
jgi:toxin HigB-1